MKYCTKCGKELMDEAIVCVGCGCLTSGMPAPSSFVAPELQIRKRERANWIGWPIIGLALQVLLFILAFVPGTWIVKTLKLYPLNGTIEDAYSYTFAQRAWMYPRTLTTNCTCIVLIAAAICSVVFYARQCCSKHAQRGHIITISAAVAECLSFIICAACFPRGVFPDGDRYSDADGVIYTVISREYELGEMFHVQLILYLILIVISILGCVIKRAPQQKPSVQ